MSHQNIRGIGIVASANSYILIGTTLHLPIDRSSGVPIHRQVYEGLLQGMDAHERVIYIGSFTKVLFPAVRVGYVVAPPSLWQRFVDAREAFDLFPPSLYQLVLAEFLREGHFARLLLERDRKPNVVLAATHLDSSLQQRGRVVSSHSTYD
jgi:aspartate/methionine/tyrosine aminotransferase